MGCTSSTANVPEPQPSTTDTMEDNMTSEESKESIIENDIISANIKGSEQIQVLPECEISNSHMQIVSDDNIKSTSDKLDMDNEVVQDTPPEENPNETLHVTESSPSKDTFVSLKVVVEKVISENSDAEEQINNVIETQNADLDRQIEEIIRDSNVSEDVELEPNDNDAKESPSPTQSEDSRATRWEALADIAAELPPSLAVDPLTGQIYSLTK